MDIGRIIAIAFVGVLCVVALKEVKPELSLFAGIATGAVIILLIVGSLTDILQLFRTVSEGSGVSLSIYGAIVKIIGIGYLTEYSASICEDYGSKSIAKKLQLAGKITIFVLSIPIITGILDTVRGILL